ncbi:MAG: hypothetical protein QOI05_4583 [Bradyrhizobium sp.]|nr:hypothetical protein [Bradyrhizobium sp.]
MARCCSATRVACCNEEAARGRLAAPLMSGTARLGVVEEVAGGALPPALGRFAKLHPSVKLEVEIGVSAELIEQLNAGRLDAVFAKRPLGTSKGRLAWREPMVRPAPTPSILFRGRRCRWRCIASGRFLARRHSMCRQIDSKRYLTVFARFARNACPTSSKPNPSWKRSDATLGGSILTSQQRTV